MKKLAWVISRIFDPIFEIPLILGVVVFYALTNGLRFRFMIFLMIVDGLIPALYLLWGLRTKRISDWDMTKRQQRAGIYFLTVFCHLFGVVYAYFLGKIVLAEILFIFWSLSVVFATITSVWKISVHAGVNGAMVAYFNHAYGWRNYWWLLVVLIFVLWSRVEIKKHSWMQVVAGSSLAIVWVELGMKLFGL